jgi:two-component system OmpR family response regulator
LKLLVVEDDAVLSSKLAQALRAAGFTVDVCADGRQAEFLGVTEDYDAALVDLGLPQLDGLSLLRAWREQNRGFPVLIITARGRWHDKLAGFEAGADDFLVKPVHIAEVVLRIQALIRRAKGHASAVLRCAGLELDTHASRFLLDGEPLQLTSQEHKILAYLMHHQDRVVSRTEFWEHIYERDAETDSNSIDVLVGRIRRKLGVDLLHTVRGVGFRLSSSV